MSSKDHHSSTSPPPLSPPSHNDLSPPPLTKLVQRTPSNPREFFEKLYGPDKTKEVKIKSPPSHQAIQIPDFVSSHNPPPPSPPFHPSAYLPTFPLPPHEAGMMSLENIPFP